MKTLPPQGLEYRISAWNFLEQRQHNSGTWPSKLPSIHISMQFFLQAPHLGALFRQNPAGGGSQDQCLLNDQCSPQRWEVRQDLERGCVLSHFSRMQLFAILWTAACQAPLSLGILQARILEWVAMPSSRRTQKRECFSSSSIYTKRAHEQNGGGGQAESV